LKQAYDASEVLTAKGKKGKPEGKKIGARPPGSQFSRAKTRKS